MELLLLQRTLNSPKAQLNNNTSTQQQIAHLLNLKGSKIHTQRALLIEKSAGQLNLRDLALTTFDVKEISTILKSSTTIKSISMSYNPMIGDTGVEALIHSLPPAITELGLVGCGIRDQGGLIVLKWAMNAKNLQMICIEQNNFSTHLRSLFDQFRKENKEMTVVY